jgi:type II secretory pathway component PulM
MEEQNSSDVQARPNSKWADRLRSRARMAVVAIGGLVALGMFGVTNPLLDRIEKANDRLKKAEQRAAVASEVANLRKQAETYKPKLPQRVDFNDWTDYLLAGIRAEPVKLVRMDPKDQAQIGPCRVLGWQVELEGDYESLGRVVSWMENGPRLVRIDRFAMQLPSGKLNMLLIVRGIAVDKPLEPPKDAKGDLKKTPTTKASVKATK